MILYSEVTIIRHYVAQGSCIGLPISSEKLEGTSRCRYKAFWWLGRLHGCPADKHSSDCVQRVQVIPARHMLLTLSWALSFKTHVLKKHMPDSISQFSVCPTISISLTWTYEIYIGQEETHKRTAALLRIKFKKCFTYLSLALWVTLSTITCSVGMAASYSMEGDRSGPFIWLITGKLFLRLERCVQRICFFKKSLF